LNEAIRKSNVNFHNPNKENNWIFERLNWAIEKMNADFYNFDLDGYDFFQYSQYKSSQLGKYDLHIDMFMGGDKMAENMTKNRKLSLTFLLNEPGVDFEGGDFQIVLGQEKDAQTIKMKKGLIIAFPSFVLHRVTPVTKGERKSIVVWVNGPKFK
jgi:PKHD-type hydroxylase